MYKFKIIKNNYDYLEDILGCVDEITNDYSNWAPKKWAKPSIDIERQRWEKLLDQPKRWTLTAWDGDILIGFVSYTQAYMDLGDFITTKALNKWAHLNAIFVLPLYQKQGLGEFLLKQSEKEMRIQNYENVQLYVPLNSPAIKFFIDNNFEEIKEDEEIWANTINMNLVKFVKEL